MQSVAYQVFQISNLGVHQIVYKQSSSRATWHAPRCPARMSYANEQMFHPSLTAHAASASDSFLPLRCCGAFALYVEGVNCTRIAHNQDLRLLLTRALQRDGVILEVTKAE